MTNTVEELETRLANMIDFVNQARDQVDSGTLANLGDLDKDVAQLCDDVEAAPPEVAQQVSSKMSDMISSLEDLARSLKTFQDNAQREKDGQGE
ncbi:MAG: hypothetical protein EOM26_08550 [Alphaproteobacteria bacterium]|nr:hypothetical protein [Alphaproteobacteria bacterium]